MIHIQEKQNCCGCDACVQICPKQCITMTEDHEGFRYPEVKRAICIDCHLCEKVCPVLHQGEPRKPLNIFAAKNRNENILAQSSSGGIFTLLAESIIEEGGVVFGACFNEKWEVIHDYTETKEGLAVFRGSKYVQSRIGDNYNNAKRFLLQGKKVLFSGTPCQISGLKLFLQKEYDNLLTIDFICHGVPSPGVWRAYLKGLVAYECEKKNVLPKNFFIDNISFRDKKNGWENFCFSMSFSVFDRDNKMKSFLFTENLKTNLYLRGFLSDIYLRNSCYTCPTKCLKSGSDITIGDFWGIKNVQPQFYDNKGVSAVLENTAKGMALFNKQNVELCVVSYEDVIHKNLALSQSVGLPLKRSEFFLNKDDEKIINVIARLLQPSFFFIIRSYFILIIAKLGLKPVIKRIFNKHT